MKNTKVRRQYENLIEDVAVAKDATTANTPGAPFKESLAHLRLLAFVDSQLSAPSASSSQQGNYLKQIRAQCEDDLYETYAASQQHEKRGMHPSVIDTMIDAANKASLSSLVLPSSSPSPTTKTGPGVRYIWPESEMRNSTFLRHSRRHQHIFSELPVHAEAAELGHVLQSSCPLPPRHSKPIPPSESASHLASSSIPFSYSSLKNRGRTGTQNTANDNNSNRDQPGAGHAKSMSGKAVQAPPSTALEAGQHRLHNEIHNASGHGPMQRAHSNGNGSVPPERSQQGPLSQQKHPSQHDPSTRATIGPGANNATRVSQHPFTATSISTGTTLDCRNSHNSNVNHVNYHNENSKNNHERKKNPANTTRTGATGGMDRKQNMSGNSLDGAGMYGNNHTQYHHDHGDTHNAKGQISGFNNLRRKNTNQLSSSSSSKTNNNNNKSSLNNGRLNHAMNSSRNNNNHNDGASNHNAPNNMPGSTSQHRFPEGRYNNNEYNQNNLRGNGGHHKDSYRSSSRYINGNGNIGDDDNDGDGDNGPGNGFNAFMTGTEAYQISKAKKNGRGRGRGRRRDGGRNGRGVKRGNDYGHGNSISGNGRYDSNRNYNAYTEDYSNSSGNDYDRGGGRRGRGGVGGPGLRRKRPRNGVSRQFVSPIVRDDDERTNNDNNNRRNGHRHNNSRGGGGIDGDKNMPSFVRKAVNDSTKGNNNNNNNTGGGGGEGDDDLPPELKGCDPKLVEMIQNEILDHSPGVTWDDIAGLEFAKKAVQEIVVWPLLRPDLFRGLRGPPKGILLFGPPGTGKTLIGKAIASESGAKFFSISASSLTSKWHGEGEKLVKTLFAVASLHQPAIIFIDEIDSLLSQRSDGEFEASRRIKTEFLVQLDGAATSAEERVLVVGATNRPQELDEAARRRLVRRLYIPLPDAHGRGTLIRRLLRKEKHELTDEQINNIVEQTKGYSGADIKSLCTDAAFNAIRSVRDIRLIENVRPINFGDFQNACQSVRASVGPDELQHYIAWDKLYGSSGMCAAGKAETGSGGSK